MLHPGPLVAEHQISVSIETGAADAIDLVAERDADRHAFLRAAWFGASDEKALFTVVARRSGTGDPVAAIPFTRKRKGPFRIAELAGPYWPYRSYPLAGDASEDELAALLACPSVRSALGPAWRIGPTLADDRSAEMLVAAARRSGWTALPRRLGRYYGIDLAALAADSWPSTKTLRKNRWLERRLAEAGALEFARFSGDDWSDAVLDSLAAIEAESWVGRSSDKRDTKFLCEHNRRHWQRIVTDPGLAVRLCCSMLRIGGEPAAFTFMIRSGDELHFIANSYSQRFATGSPGRILLYRDLQQAAAEGVRSVGWGSGDPGYKSEMGATAGAEMIDWLVIRNHALAAVAGIGWRGRASR